MPAFEKDDENYWVSAPSAMGPFKGLQGGGVAGLMVFELEELAAARDLGMAVSTSVEFLRPTEPGRLHTKPVVERIGRRVSVLSNEVFQADTRTARASVCFIRPTEIATIGHPPAERSNPISFEVSPPVAAFHGRAWMMDNFEVRRSDKGAFWFRYTDDVVSNVTPLARVLGPADWAHGLARPESPQLADPNVNLNVLLSRHPKGDFIGVLPKTTWMPTGIGLGEAVLSDQQGPFGRVMMSVALTELG